MMMNQKMKEQCPMMKKHPMMMQKMQEMKQKRMMKQNEKAASVNDINTNNSD